MKHCPKRNSSFPDTDQFCERDGTALITNNPNTSRKAFVALAVVVAAMALGVLLVACQPSSKETTANSSSQSSSNQSLAQQVVSPPPPLLPSSSATPTPSPSPSPSATPTPPVKAAPARVALSTGPIAATAEAGKRGPVIIRLTDGSTIKADEAWETAEGIWYRRRGLVTLLKRDQVKALENPKPTPTASPSP